MKPESSPGNRDAAGSFTLEAMMRTRLARAADRRHDWDTFAGQAAQDPRQRRAQIRYMHAAGAPRPGLVPASGFFLVSIVYPPGHYSPMHRHDDAEEVFFVLRGALKIVVLREDERYETVLGPHDMLSVPAGTYRQEINVGDQEAQACVIVGAGNPLRPSTLPDASQFQE